MDGPERWRETARAFARAEVEPIAEAIDRDDRFPPGLLPNLGSSGLLGVGLPVEWGGGGGGAQETVAVLEELARASAAVATLVAVHLSVAAAPIARWGTLEQKERYLRPLATGRILGAFALTEASAGSDAARLSCRYERSESGFRLRGAKLFITDADLAGVVLTFATRDPEAGHAGISAFVVTPETPGFSVAQRLEKLGLHGSTTTELLFDGATVPSGALLGREGEGFGIAMDALAGGRVGIAACALGTARAAFEGLEAVARTSEGPGAGAAVARSYVALGSAAALVREAAAEKDAGRPFLALASAAKLSASRAAVDIASLALETSGPLGARSGSRWERVWRDARVFPIVEGTTEIQELILGRELLGR